MPVKLAALFTFFTASFCSVKAQVGFGTTTPDTSAIVDIQDTARGLLIPRMTSAQKNNIPNPARGLMIFQTDSTDGFYYYTGTHWYCITNNYKQTVILTGDITNSEAAAKIAAEVGPPTQVVRIQDCGYLTSIDLSMLTSMVQVTISNNPLLQSVNLSNLKTVDDGLVVSYCPALSSLPLPRLENVGGNLHFINTGIMNLNFPLLEKATTELRIEANPNLRTISLPMLTGPSSRPLPVFSIAGNKSLVSIDAPVLAKAALFYLDENNKLVSANFPSLNSVQNLSLKTDSSLVSISFPSLTSVSKLLDIQNDSSLNSLSFPALTTVDGIYISYIRCSSITFPALTSIGNSNLFIQKNFSLNSFSLPALVSCASSVNVYSSAHLSSFSAPVLNNASFIAFLGNNALVSLSFPSLTTLTRTDFYSLVIEYCNNFSALALPALTTIKGTGMLLGYNHLNVLNINALLNKLANITPPITGKTFELGPQTPPAPPSGQGVIDKATLISLGNSVLTD